MSLHLLRSTPALDIYYDSLNDWLFADWLGELTLSTVQTACLELAQYLLRRPYTRILNSNAQVTNTQWDIANWLAQEFLPSLQLAGVEKLAWVCSPNLRGRNMVHAVINQLPQLRHALFDELDEAVSWLQQNRSAYASGYGLSFRLPATQAKLTSAVQALTHSVQVKSQALNPAW